MVVVRESPRAKISPDKNMSQWPPRSPYEVLMASPSGRQKIQSHRQRAEERSPSPSPLRRPMSSSKALQDLAAEAEEEEDEETLQLQLREIQMKLKLRKLREAKKGLETEGTGSGSQRSSQTDSIRASPSKPLRMSNSQPRIRQPDIQVPVSPTRDRGPPMEPVSPARARLGLSAVTKASDISLKRARDGTQIKRSDAQRSANQPLSSEAPRAVSSFSQKLAKSQQEQLEQQAKNDRIERSRRAGFGIADRARNAAISNSRGKAGSEGSTRAQSRGERMPSPAKGGAHVDRDGSSSGRASTSKSAHNVATTQSAEEARLGHDGHDCDTTMDDTGLTFPTENKQDGSGFDPFSGIHLSKRHIAHVDVARSLEGSEIYTLPRLLKEVKAPEYDPPDCEADFIVFGILASKSSPFNQKQGHRTTDENKPQEDATAPRNKFMVLKLVDLKWEIDLFLFGTSFDQFWKLTEGTLLAIQNPSILPPKTNQHNGRFSLKLGSSEDRVMEIGAARDLGYCKSIKKDGQQCSAWIDKRSTEVCEFHINLMIEKSRKDRMEVNTMWRGHGNDNSESRARKRPHQPGTGKKNLPGKHDREYGQLFTVNTGLTKGTAALLDADDTDALHNMTTEEASRKRIAAAQRERDLAKKLDSMGSSVGLDYLRAKHSSTTTTTRSRDIGSQDAQNLFEKPSVSSLGLLNNSATAMRLSPAKDRKRHFGTGAISSAGRDAMGWGGAKTHGLLQPKASRLGSPEKGQTRLEVPSARKGVLRGKSRERSLSPRKRARFALEKGIREPGRESVGTDMTGTGTGTGRRSRVDDADDDDLDIV